MMELGLGNSVISGGAPDDPRLVDHIVGEVKSQGIFDKFRKDCIADVDTKPAYQNLRTRVESSVNSFLGGQTWRPDMNKNQLRETLRRHIRNAPYLDAGVERIVDQVVNPKVYSVFMPQIEDVVYKFLGIEKPSMRPKNDPCSLKDLLPKDLDPVSPESEKNSLRDISLDSTDDARLAEASGCGKEVEKKINDKQNNGEDDARKISKNEDSNEKESSNETSTNFVKSIDDKEPEKKTTEVAKVEVPEVMEKATEEEEEEEEEEEDSPTFEPIDIMNHNESNDSHMSGISELTSHGSPRRDRSSGDSRDNNIDFGNNDSQLSRISSNSRLSIVTDFSSSSNHGVPSEVIRNDSNHSKIESSVLAIASSSPKSTSRDIFESGTANYRDRKETTGNKSSDVVVPKDETAEASREDKWRCEEKTRGLKTEIKDSKDIYKEKIRELREKRELNKEKFSRVTEARVGSPSTSSLLSSVSLLSSYTSSSSSSSSTSSSSSSSFSSSSALSWSSSHRDNKKGETRKSAEDKSNSRSSQASRDKLPCKEEEKKKNSVRSKNSSNVKRHSRSREKDRRDSSGKTRSKCDKTIKELESGSSGKRRKEKKSKVKDDHSYLRKKSDDRRSTDGDGSNGSNGAKDGQKNNWPVDSLSSEKQQRSTKQENTTVASGGGNGGGGGETLLDEKQTDGSKISLALEPPPTTITSDDSCRLATNPMSSSEKREDQSALAAVSSKKLTATRDERETTMRKPKFAKNFREAKKFVEIRKKMDKERMERQACDEVERTKKTERLDNDEEKKIEKKIESVPDYERVQIIEVRDEEYDEPYPEIQSEFSLEERSKIILGSDPTILNLEERSKIILGTDSIIMDHEERSKIILGTDSTIMNLEERSETILGSDSIIMNDESSALNEKNASNLVEMLVADCTKTEEERTMMENATTSMLEIGTLGDVDSLESKIETQTSSEEKPVDRTCEEKLEIEGEPAANEEKQDNLLCSSDSENDPCLYLVEDDKHDRFMKFMKSLNITEELEKEETAPSQPEDKISSLQPTKRRTAPPKRKYSKSPLIDIPFNDDNNNNDDDDDDVVNDARKIVPKSMSDNLPKKRKIGRPRKGTIAAANLGGQKNYLSNCENFTMPLSPAESDVSATSEKALSNASNDNEKRRPSSRGNRQRYTCDDLYKPRPMFSSSSRRSRGPIKQPSS